MVKVLIDPVTYADIFLAAQICPVEISGLATVKREGETFHIFGEPIIPDQKCESNGLETDFDINAYSRWSYEMVSNAREEELRMAKLWWHSHAYSKVYFSPTDERTISGFGGLFSEWWLHLVVNKKNNYSLRLDTYLPLRLPPLYTSMVFSSPTSKSLMGNMMQERKSRMTDIVRSRVTIVEVRDATEDD